MTIPAREDFASAHEISARFAERTAFQEDSELGEDLLSLDESVVCDAFEKMVRDIHAVAVAAEVELSQNIAFQWLTGEPAYRRAFGLIFKLRPTCFDPSASARRYMAKFADAATEAREAREAAQRRDKEFEEWDVKTYEKYVMRSEPNGVESVDGRITWATEAEKRRPKIPLAEHDKLIVSTHHQSIWERLQSFYGRFCLLDLFWAINVLYALEEYFYTSNAIEFVRTRKEYLRKIKSAKAALNALRSDQLFLSSFNMRRLFHKSPKEISRRELRDISRFERNIHDVDNFAEMYEAAHATPLMRRNDPHLKEQLFVFRLSRANRHVTAVLHEIASPKSRAIYELMTLPGIDHCYDQDHIDLLCAKAGGKK